MIDFNKVLDSNQFNGLAELNEDFNLDISQVVNANQKPSVYVWAAKMDHFLYPIYVGKAGKGALKRFEQHLQGFRGPEKNGSKSGLAKKQILEFLFSKGFQILIYERISMTSTQERLNDLEVRDLDDDIEVSFYSFEEEVYIKEFAKYGLANRLLLNGKIDESFIRSLLDSILVNFSHNNRILSSFEEIRQLFKNLNFGSEVQANLNQRSIRANLAEGINLIVFQSTVNNRFNFSLKGGGDRIFNHFENLGFKNVLRRDGVFYPYRRDYTNSQNVIMSRMNTLIEIATATNATNLSNNSINLLNSI